MIAGLLSILLSMVRSMWTLVVAELSLMTSLAVLLLLMMRTLLMVMMLALMRTLGVCVLSVLILSVVAGSLMRAL